MSIKVNKKTDRRKDNSFNIFNDDDDVVCDRVIQYYIYNMRLRDMDRYTYFLSKVPFPPYLSRSFRRRYKEVGHVVMLEFYDKTD